MSKKCESALILKLLPTPLETNDRIITGITDDLRPSSVSRNSQQMPPQRNKVSMNDVENQLKTPPMPSRSHVRNIFDKVFGRMGPVWVVTFTGFATVLRWAMDGVLADSAPFSFYYLSVVLTALLARIGSAISAVILGGLCGHFLWVNPRFSLEFLDRSQVAQLVVYIFVATLCALAVAAARVLRVFDYIGTDDD